MHVLVAYSQPHGKYGRYVFTVMIHFSEPTEKAEIVVIRPETGTQAIYSCNYCGRWHTITTHFTHQTLPQSEHRKDGRLELYRYDNVEPDDWIELTLRNSELLKYQWTKIGINWDSVALRNYWRETRRDREWNNFINAQREAWDAEQNKRRYYSYENPQPFPTKYTQQDRQNLLKEAGMTKEVIYEVTLLAWDEYMQSKTDEMRVEEELIRQTMNAEQITIKELLIEPKGEPAMIPGQAHFIEGELRYLT